MRRTTIIATLLVILLIASVLLAGCGQASGDTEEQLNVAADFVIGLLSGDSELVRGSIPPEVAEESSDDIDDLVGVPDLAADDFTRTYEDEVLEVATLDATESVEFRLDPDADSDEPAVLYGEGDEETRIDLVETDDGWRVASVDGDPVEDVISIMTMDVFGDDGLGDFSEEMDCFTNQMILETGVAVYAELYGEVSVSMDELIPDWVEQVTYCPDKGSQYSELNSENGYFDGLGSDGILEACTVHGHHTESDTF